MGKHSPVDAPAGIAAVETPWRTVLLSCRKCEKKLDGGFGPDGTDGLLDVLKRTLRERGQRRAVRLLRSPCLGLCPKNAVTVLRAETPDRMLVVPRGASAELLAERLLEPPPPVA